MNDHNIVITPTDVQDIRPIKIADNVNLSVKEALKNNLRYPILYGLGFKYNYPILESRKI
jgi:hypothetical protein